MTLLSGPASQIITKTAGQHPFFVTVHCCTRYNMVSISAQMEISWKLWEVEKEDQTIRIQNSLRLIKLILITNHYKRKGRA